MDHTQEAFKELQRQNELILKSVGEGIYGVNAEGISTFINPAGLKMLGLTEEEFVGKPQHKPSHRKKRDGTYYTGKECPIFRSFTEGVVNKVTTEEFIRKGGTRFPVEYVSTPVFDEQNELIGAAVAFRDVTERVEKDRAFKKLTSQRELILKSAGEGIYGLDQNGFTTFVNPAAERMLGWKAEELLGKPQHAVIHHTRPDGAEYPHEECPIYAAFKDGVVHHVSTEVFWRKDGSSFPVEYVSTPIRDDQAKLVGAVVTFMDITDRLKSEQALKNALDEVEQLKNRLQDENIYLQEEINIEHNFEEIISRSEKFKKVLGKIEQVAATDANVLILGETGTGKELIARAIHHMSKRKDRPLVKVNCAALAASLIESELFGHEKGAFTGALTKRIGRFELAHGGTIFLDEIGDLPLGLQAKLLRILQEGEFERLGNSQTMTVDVRVIAATNRDIKKATQKGEYRQDLYYRLSVFPIQSPPLRERKEDISLLVKHFTKKYGAKLGKTIETIPQKVMRVLEGYSWPGNVRELENVIERAVILSPDEVLRVDELFDPAATDNSEIPGPSDSLQERERAHIVDVLKSCHWIIEGPKGAAKRLDMSPSTLRDRMRKHDISKPSKDQH
jgi:PAS domain S-box-containing protein